MENATRFIILFCHLWKKRNVTVACWWERVALRYSRLCWPTTARTERIQAYDSFAKRFLKLSNFIRASDVTARTINCEIFIYISIYIYIVRARTRTAVRVCVHAPGDPHEESDNRSKLKKKKNPSTESPQKYWNSGTTSQLYVLSRPSARSSSWLGNVKVSYFTKRSVYPFTCKPLVWQPIRKWISNHENTKN